MRCAECPLSLACWSGNLGITRARPELCPQCKRFVVAITPEQAGMTLGKDITGLWYALRCEQRPWSRGTQRLWRRQQQKEKERLEKQLNLTRSLGFPEPHHIPEAVHDPVNRLPMGLCLGVCVICSGWVAHWKGKYVDLDEQLEAEKEDA